MSGSGGWQPIADAQFIRDFTVADLKMPSGRIYRATWKYIGRACAWQLAPGQARKRPIGLYDPVAFRVLAEGIGGDGRSVGP